MKIPGGGSFNEGRTVLTLSVKQETRLLLPDTKGLEEDDAGAEKAKILTREGASDG